MTSRPDIPIHDRGGNSISTPIEVPGISRLAPYQQGKHAISGVAHPIKLSSNESAYGPSPAALAAYRSAAGQLHRYPDGSQSDLRQAIGAALGLDPDRIICGNGSDEMILLMIRAYLQAGDQVILSENNFEMAKIHAIAQGGDVRIASERDDRVDVRALLGCVTSKSKLCIVANPNNPTGTYITGRELRSLQAELPTGCLLVIDGAYAEYVDRPDYDDGASLVDECSNVVMTRTFSKIHGLASLRIGWAYCPPNVVDAVQRIRTPFNANGPALAAAAAAIRDRVHLEKVRKHNIAWLQRIADALPRMGLGMVPSVANFYLVCFPPDQDKNATEAAAHMMRRGIIPRPAGASDKCLRLTVGLDQENEAALAALADYMLSQ